MLFKKLYKICVFSAIAMSIASLIGCTMLKTVPTPTGVHTQSAINKVTPQPESSIIYAPAPTDIWNSPSAISIKDTCHSVVDGLYAMKKDLGLPEHFLSDNPIRQKEDFDPNQYFQVFTHIKISSGYTLDYIYFTDEVGIKPLLYSRKIDENPFQTRKEILDARGNPDEPWYLETHFLEQIQIDKSPESYFEYIALAMMGNQFYISNQRVLDTKVLCDHSDLRYVGDDIKGFENVVRLVDFRSVVIVDDTTATVRFITFTTWGGFFENIVVFDKENPIQLLEKFSLQYIVQ